MARAPQFRHKHFRKYNLTDLRLQHLPPTKSEILAALKYEPEAGKFYWLKPRSGATVGVQAGCNGPGGTWVIRFNYRQHYGHQLVWLVETGEWPSSVIDHVNGDPSDNRFSNLRPCTQSENLKNRKTRKDSASGYKGVKWHIQAKCWHARITSDGVSYSLGLHESKEAAARAYNKWATRLHGKFARLNTV